MEIPPKAPGTESAAISISLNLKAILGFLAALTPLVVGLTMVLQIRQDVRVNTQNLIIMEQTLKDHEKRIATGERALLTYCISRSTDTTLAARFPNVGC